MLSLSYRHARSGLQTRRIRRKLPASTLQRLACSHRNATGPSTESGKGKASPISFRSFSFEHIIFGLQKHSLCPVKIDFPSFLVTCVSYVSVICSASRVSLICLYVDGKNMRQSGERKCAYLLMLHSNITLDGWNCVAWIKPNMELC